MRAGAAACSWSVNTPAPKRSRPYPPMLATAPLRMAATAGVLPEYTVGSQKWKGNSPSLTLKAMKKPVLGTAGQAYGLVQVGEGNHRRDRAEDLLGIGGGGQRGGGEDPRPVETALL